MSDLNEKEKHKKHREKNLIAKHLRESGQYRLKVIKPKTDYKREKVKIKDIEKIINDEE